MPNRKPTHRSIAITYSDREVFGTLAEALRDVLRSRGHEVRTVKDGDRAVLRCQLLWIVGRGTELPRFAQLLRGRPSRPRVVLWMLEALHPPGISPRTERLGERIEEPDWQDLLGPRAGWLNRVWPCRGEAARLLRAVLARQYIRWLQADTGLDISGLDKNDIGFLSRQARWLRENCGADHGWVDHVFATTRARSAYLLSRGIDAHCLPVGFHDCWGTNRQQARDLDVVFFGHANSHARKQTVRRVLSRLAARGYRTAVFEHGVVGPAREQLLNRTRVILDIPKVPWDFPGIRLLMAIACGAVVVSTARGDTHPYVDGVHFRSAQTDQLCQRISELLEDERLRTRLAHQAWTHVRSRLSLHRVLDQALRIVDQAHRTQPSYDGETATRDRVA